MSLTLTGPISFETANNTLILNNQAACTRTDARIADALSDALLEQGALSVSMEDAGAGTADEAPLYGEPGMPVETAWPQSLINALCEQVAIPRNSRRGLRTDRPGASAGLPCRAGSGGRLGAAQPVAVRTNPHFGPALDRAFLGDGTRPGRGQLVLDPGLAFGTGSHPSTRLCLQWLEQHIRGGERVLDYGCGSGILAIAALRLGASAALGVDVDPLALLAAQANAQRNRVDARFIDTETAT